jgi:hypothetical protein
MDGEISVRSSDRDFSADLDDLVTRELEVLADSAIENARRSYTGVSVTRSPSRG